MDLQTRHELTPKGMDLRTSSLSLSLSRTIVTCYVVETPKQGDSAKATTTRAYHVKMHMIISESVRRGPSTTMYTPGFRVA